MSHGAALLRQAAATTQAPTLAELVPVWMPHVPLPAGGATLERWRMLAAAGALDLSLVKLFEGHTDALAILAELHGPPAPPQSLWGTWCAEPPSARLTFESRALNGVVHLNGIKAWCSGAAQVSHALVSAWDSNSSQWLVAVGVKQPGVRITDEGWHAVGMAPTRSVDVHFRDAVGTLVGGAGDYVQRPGFWHGGGGIAACWWGGAYAIASMTQHALRSRADPHALAHLGAIDIAMASSAATLREAAAWIDAHPLADAQLVALRVRSLVEAAATTVMQHAGRALGAGPLCRNARFAQAMADLPVYLRQSHAERDLAALAALVLREEAPWPL